MSENLLTLMDDPWETPDYPSYTFELDEDGNKARDADNRYIPNVRENLEFRVQMQQQAEASQEFQEHQIHFCQSNILYFINVWCWTFDPRLQPPHIPFVTYPFQDDLITWCLWLIKNRETGLVEKSRDMGMTWAMEALSAYLTLFYPGMVDYQMSLREDDVDNRAEDSLLGKYRYIIRNVPDWMRGGWVEKEQGTDQKMQIRIPQTGSMVRGQLTMGTSGRSGRGTRVFNDEFAFVEDADKVLKALASLAPSGLYGSTPNGAGNAFYVMAHRPDVRKKSLHWSDHPMKNPEWAEKERGKITYTEESWAQEHEISYEMSTSGRVYPEFKSFSDGESGWCHVGEGPYFEYDPNYDVWAGMDFGVGDPTSVWFAQRKAPPPELKGKVSECLMFFSGVEDSNRDVDWLADILRDTGFRYRDLVGDYRSGLQRTPTGETWVSLLRDRGFNIVGGRSSEFATIMQVKLLLSGGVKAYNEPVPMLGVNRRLGLLTKAFQNWSFPTEKAEDGSTRIKTDLSGKKFPANHDQWSHSMKAVCYLVDWLYGKKRGTEVLRGEWNYPAIQLNVR